ncbi:zinc finger HIT domain-containing protein 2, partial [Empidonax traillii]|uniref:zinc finger HIT domain-containing protein 2 n=1 Tax=Empidonax traillii TaxID=164674 RepID=UPI000FFCFB21
MAAPGADLPCGLCGAAAAPYTCPRCHRRLCCLRCYRAHGPCAEAFYREQVLRALRGRRAAAPGELPALRDPPEEPPEDPPEAARPAGLWERLSEAQRAEFRRLLSSGEAAALLLPRWRPWWWRGRAPVEELGGDDTEDEETDKPGEPRPGRAPPVPAAVPPLSSLRSGPCSPLLRFQLPNALFGYAFALSLHGGDESLVPELPAAALACSAALREPRGPARFCSTAQALLSARRDARAAGLPLGPLGDSGALLAVAELLEGRDPLDPGADAAAALGHLGALLGKGARALPPPERGPFRAARKKVEFLLSWSRAEPAELARLAREAREVHAEVAEEEAAMKELREGLERGWGGTRPPRDGDEEERGVWGLLGGLRISPGVA